MTDEEDDLFNDALSELDGISLDEEEKSSVEMKNQSQTRPKSQESQFQPPFPYAPPLNDPNIPVNEDSVKFFVDSNQWQKAIDTMINILRSDNKRIDKNIVPELVIKIVDKGNTNKIERLLPYLAIATVSEDPVLKMSINTLMLHLKNEYEVVQEKIKNEIKEVIKAIYDQYNTTYIPLTDLVYNIGTSIELIYTILTIMIESKEINGNIDTEKGIFEYEPKGGVYRCPHCGKEVEPDSESCPYCWNDIFKCGICFRFIKEEERVVCPFCDSSFHEKHLVEWVRKSGACPLCQNKLNQTEIATVVCCVCGREIKKGEKDIVECPHCKSPAHKKHWDEYMDVYDRCPECNKKIK
ncbi:MAG: hypothetical protein EU549_04760 [Promethearchaeota archaeon]|nr:MAG: hypothetical protein EU549_04760 [Candidatus Lokiarchaeota archaeon]